MCCLSFLLGLLAMVESDEDYTEDEEMILSLILQDDSQPEAESRPSAQFYRCTKVLAKLAIHCMGLLPDINFRNDITHNLLLFFNE